MRAWSLWARREATAAVTATSTHGCAAEASGTTTWRTASHGPATTPHTWTTTKIDRQKRISFSTLANLQIYFISGFKQTRNKNFVYRPRISNPPLPRIPGGPPRPPPRKPRCGGPSMMQLALPYLACTVRVLMLQSTQQTERAGFKNSTGLVVN